jgi:hypothetical protein
MERVAKQVGERHQLQRLQVFPGALGLGIEAAQALDGVAVELDPHRAVQVGREEIQDPAAARRLAGCRHRVLVPVAAFVQGLQQQLRQQLFAGAEGDHPGVEQARRKAGAEQARGGSHHRAQPGTRGGVQRSGAAQAGIGVAGQAAKGRRARSREGERGAGLAQLPRQGAQVERQGVDLPARKAAPATAARR